MNFRGRSLNQKTMLENYEQHWGNKKKSSDPSTVKNKKNIYIITEFTQTIRKWSASNLILHEQFHFINRTSSYFHISLSWRNKKKAMPILYKVSDDVLAMSSSCYVLGETLWMHHFEYHETRLKYSSSRTFFSTIFRFTIAVYLYNVK